LTLHERNFLSRRSVCVVIVNYNAGAMLTECVRSVLASTVPVEVFLSDNGSQDDSIAFLRAALGTPAPVTIIENRANLGFAKGCNAMLPRCRSEYVLFLNPDCVIEPDTLEQMIRVMDAHPDAGMASCLVLNPDGTEQAGCRRFVPTPWRSMVRVLHLHRVIRNHPRFRPFMMTGLPLPPEPDPVEAISGAFMFVRSAAIKSVGAMDERYFLHCEDLDWCMRFRAAGWKILFVPHVRITHWKGASGRTHPARVEYHKHRGMIRFYNKFFRHQYPGFLMVAVVAAVCVRFVLKASWVTLCRLIGGKRSAGAPVRPSGSAAQ
jgi:GT2 family glycosyltransferase